MFRCVLLLLPGCLIPTSPPPAVGDIDEVTIFGGSAVQDDDARASGAPGGLTLWGRSDEGCASFAGATATMNGLPMEVSDGAATWSAFWTRWECGTAGASRSFDDLDPDAPAEDAEIVVAGPHVDLRVTLTGAVARFRFAFDEDPSQLWPGRAIPFRFVPTTSTTINFVTLRVDATQESHQLVVGEGADGGYVLWIPEDAPLGPTNIHASFEIEPAIECEGTPSCDYLGARFEEIPTTVTPRPAEVPADPAPAVVLWP